MNKMGHPLVANRLSVRQRLVLGLGLVIALLLALAAASLWQSGVLGRQMERMIEHHNRRIDLAHRMNSAQLEWMVQLRLLMLQEDPEDLKAQAALLDQAKSRYLDIEKDFAALAADGADGGAMQREMAAVREMREALAPVHESALRSLLSGAGAQAAQVLLMPAESNEAKWRERIVAMVDAVAAASRAEYELARAQQRLATAGIGGITFTAVLVAVFTAATLIRSITRPVDEAVAVAERIAEGRLDAPISAQRNDEFGRLLSAMATMQQRLRGTVQALQTSAESVRGASDEIGAGSQHLSERAEQAALRLQQTTSALRQLGEALASAATAAQDASTLAARAREDANQGHAAVARLVAQIQHIAKVSQRITEIVGTIDGIAFQTNVLALNAAVEAARAGNAGRGFSVVAAEVRALAQRAAEAAGQIRSLSGETTSSVRQGEDSVAEVNGAVNRLLTTASNVAGMVDGIAATTVQQSGALSRVDESVLQLETSTQQNAALAEQLAAAAASLQDQAAELQNVTGAFELGATWTESDHDADPPAAQRPEGPGGSAPARDTDELSVEPEVPKKAHSIRVEGQDTQVDPQGSSAT